MSHAQMSARCPGSRFLYRAYLKNYAFVYDGWSGERGGAVANVLPAQGSRVWGGVFEINESNLASLDKYEGYPKAYSRTHLQIHDNEAHGLQAVVYFHPAEAVGEPSLKYGALILEGAKDCGLPEEYVQSLQPVFRIIKLQSKNLVPKLG